MRPAWRSAMEMIESEVYKGHRIEICTDDDPDSPRNWSPFGTMVCWHRRHALGDKHEFEKPRDFENWADDPERGELVMVPLYLYDHSGITMSTKKFSCQWDSGQVGWIYVSASKVLEEYKNSPKFKREVVASTLSDKLTDKLRKEAEQLLEAEVEVYDQYLKGDVYGYKVFDNEEGEGDYESCWGHYGMDYCKEQARAVVDTLVKRGRKVNA